MKNFNPEDKVLISYEESRERMNVEDDVKPSKNVEKVIKGMEDSQKKVDETCEETGDEKSVSMILHEHITENVIRILQDPNMVKMAKIINNKISAGDELGDELMTMMSVAMVNSSMGAIVYYDQLLKEEIHKHFDALGEYVNGLNGELKAYSVAVDMFSNQLKKNEVDKLEKEVNK